MADVPDDDGKDADESGTKDIQGYKIFWLFWQIVSSVVMYFGLSVWFGNLLITKWGCSSVVMLFLIVGAFVLSGLSVYALVKKCGVSGKKSSERRACGDGKNKDRRNPYVADEESDCGD